MGTIWAWPPPVAPPFMPKLGPSEGSRRQIIVFLPMRLRASPRPTVVVVLPSPAGVGLIAVTRMSLPSGGFERRLRKSSSSLARKPPNGRKAGSGTAIFAALSAIGLRRAARAISMSDAMNQCLPLVPPSGRHKRSATNRLARLFWQARIVTMNGARKYKRGASRRCAAPSPIEREERAHDQVAACRRHDFEHRRLSGAGNRRRGRPGSVLFLSTADRRQPRHDRAWTRRAVQRRPYRLRRQGRPVQSLGGRRSRRPRNHRRLSPCLYGPDRFPHFRRRRRALARWSPLCGRRRSSPPARLCARAAVQRPGCDPARPPIGHQRALRDHSPPELSRSLRSHAWLGLGVPLRGGRRHCRVVARCLAGAHRRRGAVAQRDLRRRIRRLSGPHLAPHSLRLLSQPEWRPGACICLDATRSINLAAPPAADERLP